MIFTNNLSTRIKADYKRLELSKFQNIWCCSEALCKLMNETLEITI